MSTIELGKQARQEIIAEMRGFFLEQREEDISDFQAGMLLDFMLGLLAPGIYNQALVDAHQLMSRVIDELYTLEKRPR